MKWLWMLALLMGTASGARILVILPTIVKSHFTMFEPYLKALASKGHKLTVVSMFPQKQAVPNYQDIVIEGDMKAFGGGSGLQIERVLSNMNPLVNVRNLNKFGVTSCETFLVQPSVQKLIKSSQEFDAVIHDLFHADCFLAFAHKFRAVSIGVSTSVLMPWANDRMGNPDNPSYIPNLFSPYTNRMNVFQRMSNALTTWLYKLMYRFLVDRPCNTLVRQHFGEDTPDLSELARNTSLVLVNTHFTVTGPRPLVPGVVEVGGIHIKPKPLPKHLQDYLDGADHGAIYFSLGSMLQAETFPEDKRDAFLQAFAELPQRVLWKWEADSMPGQPKNVRTEKWCPQLDILQHPKVEVFISHGGLLGSLEAVYSGVPVIGIPFYGDQRTNLANLQARGMAVQLEYHNITKESVLEALRTILDNVRYMENARRVARMFRHRPQSALDAAVFWTEYVIEYKGAPHMRSAAVDLALHEYLLLDVFAIILAAIAILVWATRKAITAIIPSKTAVSKKKRH